MLARDVRVKTLSFIREQILNSRGSLVTFRAAKIAKAIAPSNYRNGKALTLAVKEYLEYLVKRGYVKIIKETSRGRIYGVTKDSPLWNLLLVNSPDKLQELAAILES
ncbi:MAG: DNA-binding protein [Thermoprotei archaeon]|nr:MAG: DNA-binding protein [Thermoprotei archaeon]